MPMHLSGAHVVRGSSSFVRMDGFLQGCDHGAARSARCGSLRVVLERLTLARLALYYAVALMTVSSTDWIRSDMPTPTTVALRLPASILVAVSHANQNRNAVCERMCDPPRRPRGERLRATHLPSVLWTG
jgi:hypothetical protein